MAKKGKIKKNLTYLSLILFVLAALTAFTAAVEPQDQNDDLERPIPKVPKINLSGSWDYKASSGLAGTIYIYQKGKSVTLVITSGAECRPVEVCNYTGTHDKSACELSNSVIVDKEGGTITSTMQLIISSNKLVTGSSTSHYAHPEGYDMQWDMTFTLTRGYVIEEKDDLNTKKPNLNSDPIKSPPAEKRDTVIGFIKPTESPADDLVPAEPAEGPGGSPTLAEDPVPAEPAEGPGGSPTLAEDPVPAEPAEGPGGSPTLNK